MKTEVGKGSAFLAVGKKALDGYFVPGLSAPLGSEHEGGEEGGRQGPEGGDPLGRGAARLLRGAGGQHRAEGKQLGASFCRQSPWGCGIIRRGGPRGEGAEVAQALVRTATGGGGEVAIACAAVITVAGGGSAPSAEYLSCPVAPAGVPGGALHRFAVHVTTVAVLSAVPCEYMFSRNSWQSATELLPMDPV